MAVELPPEDEYPGEDEAANEENVTVQEPTNGHHVEGEEGVTSSDEVIQPFIVKNGNSSYKSIFCPTLLSQGYRAVGSRI